MVFKKIITSLLLATMVASTSMANIVYADHEHDNWQEHVPALKESWDIYRDHFIQTDGRVIDHRIGISTSEGQSYAMLRAVMLRDKEWFDKSYQWAKDNLQVRDDKLFAWKWGERADKTWGPMDDTAASDADQDIALALLLASEIWETKQYKTDALEILDDIWDKQTIPSPIGRVMLPGDWKIDKKAIQINPSYFAPYAYRVFAKVDRKHRWEELVDSSYHIMQKSMALTPTHLPPDWVEFSTIDGSIKLYEDITDTRSDYGYEAIRVLWRVAFDHLLNPKEDRAMPILKATHFLPHYWTIKKDLPGALTYDGILRRDKLESAAVYGTALPALHLTDKEVGEGVLDDFILPNLKADGQWNTNNDYYSQNWLWFGLAAYTLQNKPMDLPRRQKMLERLSWILSFD